MPGFHPPLDFERRQLLDPKVAPFFRHGEAAFFIASDAAGRPLGRISAQVDHLMPAERAGIGQFGCLDAVDDPAVVAALIAAARRWHAERGRHRLEGPFTFSINEETGVQIEGQEAGDMLLMPWHPRYLGAHVEAAGLVPVKDLLAYWLGPEAASEWTSDRVDQLGKRSRVTARFLNLKDLAGEAAIMAGLFNSAWKDNWGFVPLAAGELLVLLRTARPILRPSHAVFLEVDGQPGAFAFAMPNAYELIRGFGGRLLPFNWARLLWRVFTHRFETGRVLLLGLRSDLRGTALGSLLPVRAVVTLVHANPGHPGMEMSWILEDNRPVRRIIENVGGQVYKRYRVYADPAAEGAGP